MKKLTLLSTSFSSNSPIPVKYTGDGDDVSPPLTWTGTPDETRELALICDDPDAPTPEPWVHWVIYKIPATAAALPEGVAKTASPDNLVGARQGLNSWKRVGYGGPAPPRGHGTHHYHFKLFALDVELDVTGTPDKQLLLSAMHGHVLAQGELIGTYER